MPDFSTHQLDLASGRGQVEELRALLRARADLGEAELSAFFEPRTDLVALIGYYNPAIRRPDRVAREYSLFGTFRCDLAVGDSAVHAFTFIEMEDAGPHSLFRKQGEKATREWSRRFEHGYSQLIDWFYKLDDQEDSAEMEARLGKHRVHYTGVLIVGRDHHMEAGESSRLAWRRERTVVNSKQIVCVTYDQLLDDLTFRLDTYELAAKAGG